jgi:hypothetical protein
MAGRFERVQIRPEPNGLAIIRTCQAAHDEIGDSWLRQVLFDFEESQTMLDTLVPSPRELIGKIRHMRVSTMPLLLSTMDDDTFYRVPAALRFLAGLQLDVLYVHDDIFTRVPEVTYKTFDDLVHTGDGWKELHFISKDSAMFAYGEHPDSGHYYRRAPLPAHWNQILSERAGDVNTLPTVSIHRTLSTGDWNAIQDPSRRQAFSQVRLTTEEKESSGLEKDLTLSRPEEIGKAVLIVARRGDVDYTQGDYRPGGGVQDMRDDYGMEEWADLKAEFVEKYLLDDDYDDDDEELFDEIL